MKLEFWRNLPYSDWLMEQVAEQISVTDTAIAQINKILRAEASGAMLRVAVLGGGCSGFQYSFSIDKKSSDDDHIIGRDGAKILVDTVSLTYMAGSKIDWVDDLIGASFQIKNPNATAACGCGTSFSV